MHSFIDSHYLPLPFQGNTFSSVKFQKIDGTTKILVASLKRKIYIIEYEYLESHMEPITREIFFAYIPAGSEISSLDILNRSTTVDDFVIGTVILKSAENGASASLNLYSEYDLYLNSIVSLDTISQSCETLILRFVPYGLHHVQISPHQVNGIYENLWLLPGNDHKIHAYKCYYSERHHDEVPVENYFIEFSDLNNIVFSIDVFYYNNHHNRVSCLGCENGYMRCCIVNCDDNSILHNMSTYYENPISSVQLFTLKMPEEKNNPLQTDEKRDFAQMKIVEVNLLVTNTIFHSEVFMDVLNQSLKNKHCLLESTQFDVCTCSVIGDVDFDGTNEIIFGTYGEKLLFFKYMLTNTWDFVDVKKVPSPVHKLFYEDLTEDGVSELITVTSKGVNIYQHDLKKHVLPLFVSRLKYLME